MINRIKVCLRAWMALFFIISTNSLSAQDAWNVIADDIDPNNYFGVTVANGMVGIVSSPNPLQVQDVILNGVYDYYQRGRVSNILKSFNHVDMYLDVDGHRISGSTVSNYQQQLNMRSAELVTTFDVGDKISVEHSVMSLRHLPYSALIKIEILAKQDVTVTPMSVITAPDHLTDVRNYFWHIDRPHARIPLLTSVAKSPSGSIELAASNAFIFPESHHDQPEVVHEDWDFNRHWMKFYKALKSGERYTFYIVATTCSSKDYNQPQNEAERLTIYANLEGAEQLITKHRDAWEELWKSDIKLESNPGVNRDIRFALYHLYSFAREGTALSLSPMGLSGLGYNGHVFWDTELWMYPPLLVLQPGIARSLLEYRFERLEAAKQNAFAHGFKGAMFPWESAEDGSEDTPVWALTGPYEHHITGCIGWAAWKYYQVTQDKEWLRNRGWPILKNAADFWTSRVEREGPGKYNINNVIGANEWEENIDNNAFTNAVAILCLQYATSAADVLDYQADPDWNHVAENIPILEFPDGTTKENATYTGQEIKQADVILLTYPLGLITDEEQVRKNLEYYNPRTSPTGPAMGAAISSILYNKLGDGEKAEEIFEYSYKRNEVPPFGVISETAGGTNPYFATGAGGMLQAVLFGFGGLQIDNSGVKQLDSSIPTSWGKLTLSGVGREEATYSVE